MPAKIVELVDVQMLAGQQVLSVFHYLDADGVADEEVLVTDYINDVLPLMAAFQNSQVQHVAIKHRQVYPAVLLQQERTITPAVVGGRGPGPCLPSFTTFSIKWHIGGTVYTGAPDPKHIKRGGKHIAGVSDGFTSGDTITDPDTFTRVATWVPEVIDPGTDPWQLVVTHQPFVKRLPGQPAPPPTPVTKYAPVLGASAPGIGTQNSRKVLRGRTY